MKRKQFSEEQLIGLLKEAEAGAVVTELCRKHGMSSATYYAWKAKFGGLEVSDAKRLRSLEEENARLKRLLADTMLDNAGLKDLLAKKWRLYTLQTRLYPGIKTEQGASRMSVLSKAYFHDGEAAFAYLESKVWANGATCPHCGGLDRITKVKANPEKRIRLGLYRCGQCKLQFTVKVGTVFEHARMPLHKMLQAVYLMTSSKKGVSAHQLHRMLEVTYKTAWFLAHRIREAMRSGDLTPFGSGGGVVEIDETFIGHDTTIKPKGEKKGRGYAHKHKVLSLVDRDTGRQRSMVVESLKAADLTPILRANIAAEAIVMTDEASQYRALGAVFAGHGFTRHGAGQYVDYENPMIHTNTIEGAFSIFKRGMKGVYQHCAKKHLHRYVAEFEFRYTHRERTGFNDAERNEQALKGIAGKRLTYSNAS